ncbi:MAG: hypothetical protein OXN94_08850 [Chloroflexota bacterium]|nr:hypothetical protein [Chloroflexota bacterium]
MVDLLKGKESDEASVGSKNALIEVVRAMHKLSLEEKAQLLEYLSRALQNDIRREAFKDVPWEAFIKMTYGSLADDPIELPERFHARELESIE